MSLSKKFVDSKVKDIKQTNSSVCHQKFYHVPRWFEYVSALGASLLVEATGKLFRDNKPRDLAGAGDDSQSEKDVDSEADTGTESDTDSDPDSDTPSESLTTRPIVAIAPTSRPVPIKSVPVQPLLSLEYLVSSLSIFDATVPHDTIYALLAIAKDTTPSAGPEGTQMVLDHTKAVLEIFTEKKSYNVDYGQPFVEVCREFVQFCIEHSDPSRALDIICRPWAPDPGNESAQRKKKREKIISTTRAKRQKAAEGSVKLTMKGKEAHAKFQDHRPPKLLILVSTGHNIGNTKVQASKKLPYALDENDKLYFAPHGEEKEPKIPSKYKAAAMAVEPKFLKPFPEETPKQDPKEKEKIDDQNSMPLPSWVPKLSGAAYDMYSQAGVHELKMGRKNADTLVGLPPSNQSLMRNYNAAQTKVVDRKSLRFRRRSKMKRYSMYVKGFILDSIEEVQPSSQGGAIPRQWAKAAGWRNAPESDPPDDFWRTLVADRGRDGRNPPVYYSRACKESFFKGGLSSGRVDTTDLISNERCSVVAQFCRRVQSVIWNRSLIRTKHTRRLGLASQNVHVTDLVCVLYGCSVPITLRLKDKKQDEIKLEIEEEIRYYQSEIAGRIIKNKRRLKAFHEKRVSEIAKYEEWDDKMETKWRKDLSWRAKYKSQLEKTRSGQLNGSHRNKDRSNGEYDPITSSFHSTKSLNSELPYWPPANGDEGYDEPAPGQWFRKPEHISKQKSQESPDNDNTESTPLVHNHARILRSKTSILPSALTFQKLSKEETTTKGSKDLLQERDEWIKKEETKRDDRKEFAQWKREQREEFKRLEAHHKDCRTWENLKTLLESNGVPQAVINVKSEPSVDWWVFERFLKYGRRWKRIMRARQKLRRWNGEYLMFCKRLKHEDPELESDAHARVHERVQTRKYFRRWKYIALKLKPDYQRWHGEYLIFWRKLQDTPNEKQLIINRLKEKLEKRSLAALQKVLERVVEEATSLTDGIPKEEIAKWLEETSEHPTLATLLNDRDLDELQLAIEAASSVAPKLQRQRILLQLKERFSKHSWCILSEEDINELKQVVIPVLTYESQKTHVLWGDYVQRMRSQIRTRYERKKPKALTKEQESELQDPEEWKLKIDEEEERVKEHNKRVDDNVRYYEFLGECYIHGMMDGEAMAYQNEKGLGAKVFELR